MQKDNQNETGSPFSALPSPPEFLVERQKRALAGNFLNDPIHHLDLVDASSIDVSDELPAHIDPSIMRRALQDRKAAEMNAAEMYSKYLEVMAFNERLLRHLRHMEMYRHRVRQVYDRLKYGDDNVNHEIQNLKREIRRQHDEMAHLNTENKALRVSLTSYEEAFGKVNAELQESKLAHEQAEKSFRILAEEFAHRGHLLSEAEDKIQTYVLQTERMKQALNDVQEFNLRLRDDNVVFKAKLQEANVGGNHPTEIGALLTNSVHRMQERLNQLEVQNAMERKQAQDRIAELEANLSNIAKSPETPPPWPSAVQDDRLQDLYTRWDKVISEMSSLSAPVREQEEAMNQKTTLISESGEIQMNP